MGTADMPCPWLQVYSEVTLGGLAENPPSGENAPDASSIGQGMLDAAKPT